MKVKTICAACLLHRGVREIELTDSSPEVKMQAIKKLFEFLSENFSRNSVSAILGTERDRIIRKETGCPDPYKKKKALSNEYALKLLPEIRKALDSEQAGYGRFRKACLAAIVANSIEFDMLEHDQRLEDFPRLLARSEEELKIDEIREIYSRIKKSKRVLYLADNAGEIVIDSLLIEEIMKLGPRVVVVVKEGPVLNDALREDAILAGIPKIAGDVITTGTDSVGLVLSQASEELKQCVSESDFIVSKGMGNYETMTEEKIRGKCIAYLLRAKCSSVAEDLAVEGGSNVAKLHCWD
ncbi:MAG: ARMT1-like domain-containing protein [Promethearchaeati archaeon SRVP18_Atabeyarchaeia-1]